MTKLGSNYNLCQNLAENYCVFWKDKAIDLKKKKNFTKILVFRYVHYIYYLLSRLYPSILRIPFYPTYDLYPTFYPLLSSLEKDILGRMVFTGFTGYKGIRWMKGYS